MFVLYYRQNVSYVTVNDAVPTAVHQLQKLSLRCTPRIFYWGGVVADLGLHIIYVRFLQLYYKNYVIGIPEA